MFNSKVILSLILLNLFSGSSSFALEPAEECYAQIKKRSFSENDQAISECIKKYADFVAR